MRVRRGFTIVELLIVIVVISILAVVSVSAYSGVQGRSRDAIRISDARSIVKALEMYKIREGGYPPTTPSSSNGWEMSAVTPDTFLDGLVTKGIMNKVPLDPENINTTAWPQKSYYYVVYTAGASGCDASRGKFYVFGVKDLEGSGRPSAESPGWACPQRDWGQEFDWVTGGFEK